VCLYAFYVSIVGVLSSLWFCSAFGMLFSFCFTLFVLLRFGRSGFFEFVLLRLLWCFCFGPFVLQFLLCLFCFASFALLVLLYFFCSVLFDLFSLFWYGLLVSVCFYNFFLVCFDCFDLLFLL